MADDIVTRLRAVLTAFTVEEQQDIIADAADEIERLRAEVDLKGYRLDDALDEIERLKARVAELEAIIDERRQAWQDFWAVHGNGR